MGGECRQRFYVLAARSKAVRLSIGRFAYFCCERVSLFTFAVFMGPLFQRGGSCSSTRTVGSRRRW
jgi:hypothetical protein